MSRPAPASTESKSRGLLFSPLTAGPLHLKNRIVALPIGLSRYVDAFGSPTERMVEMFRAKALGGAALITVEATYVEPYKPSVAGLTGLYDDSQIAQYSVLTDAMHSAGALASLEIFDRWHTDFPYEMEDMSVKQIEAMIDLYVRASVRAVMAGFDAITFQMTHGWPLSRFASPITNNRNDKYGDYSYVGSEVIRRTRAAVGPAIGLIPRFSVLEDQHGKRGVTIRQAVEQLTPAYEDAGADILDLSFGLGPIARTSKDYWATEMMYVPPGDKFHYCKAIKDVASVPVIGRSGVNTPALAHAAVDEGWMDILGLGRQLLADPEFPRKLQEGRETEVIRCTHCQFCGRVSVGGRGGRATTPGLHCSVNGALGREIVPIRARAGSDRKRVAVVGAGPAGLEAALQLATYGCQVTVFERSARVGGLIPSVAALPELRLSDLQYAVEDLVRRLETTSVDIRLNTPFTSANAQSGGFDAMILATGSSSPAESSGNMLTFSDYLSGKLPGKRVVIDAQGEGAEYAVSLARSGHVVTLVEGTRQLRPTIYDYAVKRVDALNDYILASGIAVHWNSHVVGVEGGSVVVEQRNGKRVTIEADTLLTTARKPNTPDVEELRAFVPVVHAIGDCVRLGGIGEAMEMARSAAASIAAA